MNKEGSGPDVLNLLLYGTGAGERYQGDGGNSSSYNNYAFNLNENLHECIGTEQNAKSCRAV
jgi:hypothetical protein